MKKFGIALASILLAGSLAAFAGCGETGDDTGKIDGKFKEEKDANKAAETIQKIDLSKAFGDMSKSDWALGLKVTEKVNVNLDLSVANETEDDSENDGNGGVVKTAAAATPEMQKVQAEMNYEGSGLVNITNSSIMAQAELSMKGKEKVSKEEVEMSAKAYVDGSYVYASLEVTDEDPMKVKISLEDIMGAIGNIGGLSLLDAASQEGGYTEYVQQGIQMIYQMGGKLSFDQKNGLKVKATFGDDFFANALLMASIAGGTEAAPVISGISFAKNSSIEVAVAFDKAGLFTEFGLNIDIGVNLDANKLGVVGGTVKVSGGVKVETSAEKVTLPADLATDTSYEEVDIDDLLPGGDIGVKSSIVGEYGFYAYYGEVNYTVGDKLANSDYIFNENSYTLSVLEDGTFTITNGISGDKENSSMSGTWVDNEDGTYTFNVEGTSHAVDYDNGAVIYYFGENPYGYNITFTK